MYRIGKNGIFIYVIKCIMNSSFIPNSASKSVTKVSTTPSATAKVSTPITRANSSYIMNASPSWIDRIKEIDLWIWVMIFVVLAFLGFNIFTYLGKITDMMISIWNSIAEWLNKHFGTNFAELAKQTINVSATGTKGAVDIVQGVSDTTIDTLSRNEQGISSVNEIKEPPPTNFDNIVQNGGVPNKGEGEVEAAPAYSSVGQVGQAGWCFIGEAQGTRTCSKVGQNDTCMSGDIYPTQDVCVNPNLRA